MNLPEHIGRYQIQGELGRGAMGVVYKAVDPNIGRTVALKTMRLDVHGIEEAEMLKRFKHEAVLAGVMNHPNVITIYDAGDFEGVFYMAMEFMEGTTLQVVLHEQRVLSTEKVLNISRQVSAGLDFAHQRGVIHRDIKPANIMLAADDTAKIMDFGIAKSGTSMTTAGQVLGTPTYMSPEQVRGRNLDGRSDLFSFGVCLYEMVTGEKPFTGQNITTIIYKIMNEAPIPPRELDVSIHPGVSAIITKCLAKSVDERYQSGADLFNDLQNYKSYGSAAPATKTMSAAAAAVESSISSGASAAAIQSAHDLESVTTSHIPMEAVDQALYALQPAPGNIRAGNLSTVRRTGANLGAPPLPERKKLAAMVLAILVVVLAGSGIVQWLRMRNQQQSAQTSAPGQSAIQVTNPDSASSSPPKNEKPSAAVPVPENGTAPAASDSSKKPLPANLGEARITSTPDGAKITIGGASQPKWTTPFTAPRLQPGNYDVTVAKAGYVSQTKEIEVKAANSTSVNFDLILSGATITVSSEPNGAQIFLDGKGTGKLTPATLNVDKGKHKIEVRKAGFKEENTNVNLSDGEKYSYTPSLVSGKTAPGQQRAETKAARQEKRGGFFGKIFGGGQKIPAGKGVLSIKTTPPGATIIHNGRASQVQTPIRVPMDPGSYTVMLRLDGYKNSQQTFNVSAGKLTDVMVPLEKK